MGFQELRHTQEGLTDTRAGKYAQLSPDQQKLLRSLPEELAGAVLDALLPVNPFNSESFSSYARTNASSLTEQERKDLQDRLLAGIDGYEGLKFIFFRMQPFEGVKIEHLIPGGQAPFLEVVQRLITVAETHGRIGELMLAFKKECEFQFRKLPESLDRFLPDGSKIKSGK